MEGGDVKGALVQWAKVRELDPDSPELLMQDGQIHMAAEKYAEAEDDFSRAIVIARERLGGDEPDRFSWWAMMHTRPYMLARQRMGELYWKQGRYKEAAAEHRALLDRNPPDNQGARWVVGPLLLLAGDVEAALAEFDRWAMDYGGDIREPRLLYAWALALFRARRPAEGLHVLRSAFFANLHVPPLLLGREVEGRSTAATSNMGWPDHARDIVREFAPAWRDTPGAIERLQVAWDDEETRGDIASWTEHQRELEGAGDRRKRKKHIDAASRIERQSWTRAFYARMDLEAPVVDRLHPPGQRSEPPPRPDPKEPTAEEDNRPTFEEARASGVFEAVLADLRRGVGNPTAKITAVASLFQFKDRAEVQEAMGLAMEAWNEGVSAKGGEEAGEDEGPDEGDPRTWMEDGYDAYADGETEGAVDCWLCVVRANPAIVDRLLAWDDEGIREATHPIEDEQAWRYMNEAWWETWKGDVETWTALLVFWCQPEVQRLAGATGFGAVKPGPEADDPEPIAAVVRKTMTDEGPVGKAWRKCGEILHSTATYLRDLDQEGRDFEEIPRKQQRGIAEGTAIVQGMGLLFARDGLKEARAKESLANLETTQRTLRRLQEEARDGLKRPIRSSPSEVSRNAPCPCGSGKKYKRCCGR